MRKAHQFCNEVLSRSLAAGYLPLAARAQTELGIIHASLDDSAKAIQLLESAIDLKRQLGDNHGLKQAFLCLGFAYARVENIPAVREAYERSLSLNQETDDAYGELLCLEFLTRLDPGRIKESQVVQALTTAERIAEWQNPRVRAIIEMLNERRKTPGGTDGTI